MASRRHYEHEIWRQLLIEMDEGGLARQIRSMAGNNKVEIDRAEKAWAAIRKQVALRAGAADEGTSKNE